MLTVLLPLLLQSANGMPSHLSLINFSSDDRLLTMDNWSSLFVQLSEVTGGEWEGGHRPQELSEHRLKPPAAPQGTLPAG